MCVFNFFCFHSQAKEPFTLKGITISSRRKTNESVFSCEDCVSVQTDVGGVQVSVQEGRTPAGLCLQSLVEQSDSLTVMEKGISELQRCLTCSLVCIHADKLCGALMWRSAGLTVLHMLSTGAVPESMAVSSEVYLNKHTSKEWSA